MSDDLIFEEPPRLHGGGFVVGSSPVGQWLNSLRQHPGSWAKFPDPKSATIATRIKRGTAYGVQRGEFEVRTVKIDGDTSRRTIYARYVGTPDLRAVETA